MLHHIKTRPKQSYEQLAKIGIGCVLGLIIGSISYNVFRISTAATTQQGSTKAVFDHPLNNIEDGSSHKDKFIDKDYFKERIQKIKEQAEVPSKIEDVSLNKSDSITTPIVTKSVRQPTHKDLKNVDEDVLDLSQYLSDNMIVSHEKSSERIAHISTIVTGQLVTGIDTASQSSVLVKLSNISAPKLRGSTLKGQISSGSLTNKVYISFTTLILQDGAELDITASGIDSDGNYGIPGQVSDTSKNNFIKSISQTAVNLSGTLIGSADIGDIISDTTQDSIQNINTDNRITIEKGASVSVIFEAGVYL